MPVMKGAGIDAWRPRTAEPLEDAMMYRFATALGLIALVSPQTWAGVSVDASTYTVHCNTVIGTIAFSPGLTTGGTETSVTGKVKTTLAGCTATPSNGGPDVTIESASVSGKLVGSSNDCAILVAGGPATGSLKAKWKTTPKLADSSSIVTVSGLSFSAFFPPFPFTGTYGAFQITASAVSGSFQGSDGGASSIGHGTTGQDINTLLAACASSKGLKLVNFGFGDLTLQ